MPVGCHRQLALAARGELAVAWNHLPDELPDQLEECTPLLHGEIAAALGEMPDERIGAPHGLADPGQVVPDRKVVHELVRGIAHAFKRAERLGDGRELEIRTEALDHLLALSAQTPA